MRLAQNLLTLLDPQNTMELFKNKQEEEQVVSSGSQIRGGACTSLACHTPDFMMFAPNHLLNWNELCRGGAACTPLLLHFPSTSNSRSQVVLEHNNTRFQSSWAYGGYMHTGCGGG
eukprot:1157706-Pelagomonas_calceolata.AAC.5